jgi:hypothetical protein
MKKMFSALLAALLLAVSVLPVAATEEAAPAEVKPGTMIYEQKFDMPDAADQNTALAQLNWTVQNKALKAYTDPTANIVISDGRLAVTGASDTYYLMLTEEQMAPYDGKTITIQYDMEYTTASNSSRYFCILANYAGQKYNSFHFRNAGYANNQAHIDGSWVSYDAYNPATDIYAAATDGDNGSSIAFKLLGKKYNSGNMAFSGLPVTVRYVLDPSAGISVYMKLAEKAEEDFVLVSATDPAADGVARYGTWDANAICLKIGGQQNGYIDNIAIWTGSGDYPQPEPQETVPEETEPVEEPTEPEQIEEPEEEKEPEEPKKVREPQTIVNKIAIWAVALFGGFIIYKKGKEEHSDQ